MNLNYKHFIILFFVILAVLILSSKTTVYLCEVCGVQQYERSLFGKKLEFISNNEVDELGTYEKWRKENDTVHQPHIWHKVDSKTKELLTH